MTTRSDHLRLAVWHLALAARAEPRRARELVWARREAGHAWNADEPEPYGAVDEAEFVSVKRAAHVLRLREDSVRATARRHGDRVGVLDGRDWLIRATWVAAEQARRGLLPTR